MSWAKHIDKGLILLTGDESAIRREALDGILDELGMAKDDFDLEYFDGDGSTPIAWLGSVGTIPFMAEKRVAIVRHVLRLDPDKAKGVDFGTIPSTGLLILVADDEPATEERQARLKTADRNWRKVVEKAKGSVVEAKADPKRTKDAIRLRITAAERTITDRGLDSLVEMCGGSLSRCVDELDKLLIYIGDQKQIREGDVQAIVLPSREWNVFRMVDAIVGGDVGEALRQLRTLLVGSPRAENAAHSQITPMVSRALRLLWQARVCVDANTSPDRAPEAVRACFPTKPNIASEQPYRQSALMTSARRVTLDQVAQALTILSDADSRLKGALDGFSSIETLERMVLEMAQALAPTPARR